MPGRMPALLAAPAAGATPLWLTGARLLDGTGAAPRPGASVLVRAGRIDAVGGAGETPPPGASVIDLAGRTLMPGLVDAHAHIHVKLPPPEGGVEPLLPGTTAHMVASYLREALRRGFTTMRDVGSYQPVVVEARQAMRLGAFRGPRLLTCGRIISATSPGGRFFDGMYREADGADDVRRAVREQLRLGADFVKLMTTGARTVELEDPDPAQMTPAEIATAVEEAHRLGVRVAAHAEGLAGTELAVLAGIDTIEHGMYLHERPDLLERMAEHGQVLVPTLSCFYGVAGRDGDPASTWSPLLVELAEHNLEAAGRTLTAAHRAGVKIALGHDWNPFYAGAREFERMIAHGLPARDAVVAATATAAAALGLEELGTVEPGKLADLLVVDGDPLTDPGVLGRREKIWLVVQLGEPVAGSALEAAP